MILEKSGRNEWDKTITSRKKLFDLRLRCVWDYKDLIFLFIKRDFIVYYKQTILGPLWYLIQPICSTIMYMLIFGELAGIGTDNIPQILFYFSGTMLWSYFSDTLIKVANVFTENKAMFGKVYFPRLVVPIALSIGLIIKLLIQFFLFSILFVYYFLVRDNIRFSWLMLLFPLLVLWIGLLAIGIGMIVSSITTKYRDIAMILAFFVQLLMYATPVVYPLSEVPENMKLLFIINPVSAPIEFFRKCFFGVGKVTWSTMMLSLGITVVCLLLGLLLFNKNERTFVDVI